MAAHKRTPSLPKIGCLIALVVFSGYVAIVSYPAGAWRLGAAFAALAFASIFLRVGWFVPFAIAGTYTGMILDARVKGGTIESQMQETVTSIVVGTICGFVIGAFIDASRRSHLETAHADEQPDEREPE
jgi:hypothetical protein